MAISTYRRSLAPGKPESLPSFLNHEHQKLEQTLDGVREAITNIQPAIADDASGAVNQATVNAILLALRKYGIIVT